MRELNSDETSQVGGGILPVVAFGLALAGHAAGFSGVTTWAISSASLVGSTFAMAQYLSRK